MTMDVPQEILDALTDVDMPRLPPEAAPSETVRLAGVEVPVYRAGCIVVGSGAAGLRAAVELKRRGDDVVIVSQSAWGGTSACSGADKQTLHTANTADQGDNYKAMARSIRSGGAMDEDTAYVEAVGSSRMMASLQFLGLPLPQDPLGGTLRYQTDHDEVGRATSCGPRTSRLMVKVLAEEAIRLGVPFYNQTTAVKILTGGEGADRHVVGMLVMRASDRTEQNPLGIALFVSSVIVLAAGGPGELYRDSVYPNGCFGSLGLALEAGVELVNLTESQFGIGTRREGFPWNLSGTYVQAIPHIYSLDRERVHMLQSIDRHVLVGAGLAEIVADIFVQSFQAERQIARYGQRIAVEVHENAPASGSFAGDGEIDQAGAEIEHARRMKGPLIALAEDVRRQLLGAAVILRQEMMFAPLGIDRVDMRNRLDVSAR